MRTLGGVAPAANLAPRRVWDVARALRPDPVTVAGLLLFLGLWYLAHWGLGRAMPPPHQVFAMGVANLFSSEYFVGLGLPEGGYLPHLLSTTGTVLLGVLIGTAVGVASGLASARIAVVDQITDPIISLLGTVPIMVATPFFLIWFGLASSTKIILVAFYSAVVLHIYAYRAVAHVNPRYTEYALTLGARPRMIFTDIVFPACVPELFGGIRTAFASAWGLAAIAELLGALRGVGRALIAFWGVFDVAAMMAAILWLGIIATVLDGLIVALRRYVTRWSLVRGDV